MSLEIGADATPAQPAASIRTQPSGPACVRASETGEWRPLALVDAGDNDFGVVVFPLPAGALRPHP